MYMRLSDYLDLWLTKRSASLAPRTRDCYAATIRNHIIPSIGHVDLAKLRPLHVTALLNPLQADGHGRTAQLVYAVLHAALNDRHMASASPSGVDIAEALRNGVIALDQVPRPSHTVQHYQHLQQADIPRYLDAIAADRLALAWMLALLCGLRRGEICGLRWPDVDLAAMMLHVHAQRVTLANGRTIDTGPKSASGRRDVPIPTAMLPLLAIAQQPSGYVVTNQRGAPFTPSGLDQAHREMVARAGLPPVTPHGLRHTMATMAVSSGVHIRVLQQLLGHANYQTTADTYAHVYDAAAAAAVDSIASGMLHSPWGTQNGAGHSDS